VSDVAEGDAWTDVTPASSDWVTAGSSPPASAGVSPSIAFVASEGDELVAVTFDTGASNALTGLPVTLSIRPAGSETRSTLPVIVSEQLIAAAAFRIGDTFAADIGGGERALEIVGAVRAFPTIAPEQPAIIIADLETLAALQLNQPGVVPVDPDTRWLAVDAGNAAAVADALERQPFSSSRVASRQLRAQALRTDPVTLGAIGALSIGFLAAAVFAVIGFIVSASVSARERLREFALLRALGLSPRQLAGWLLLENGFLVVTSLVGGTLLGLLLAWLVLPLIAITQEATQVFPRVVIVIPWGTFSLLQAALIAALVVLSGILVLALQRRGLGTALRIGEH
jgi:predicted lysophospholipase L1 biosynthesis ABC-type transport system permease subunit